VELILRGSEYQDFLNCRKKWYYSWIEKIEPKRPDNKLFFGTVFHKFLENYYLSGCNWGLSMAETLQWINEQDMSGLEQFEIDELIELFKGVASNYNKTYGEMDKSFEVIGTEVEFLVKLDHEVYMTGTIDLIYKLDGKVRFADHKTVASLSMYEDKSQMDRQISRYWWALEQVAAGIGKVKDRTEGNDRWISFPDLEGQEIAGFDYNLIAKDFPKQPKVLKPKKGKLVGDLSQDKSQKTTYDLYLNKIQELGHDESDYTEFLEMLKDKPDPFLKRLDVQRLPVELEASAMEFLYTAEDIKDVKETLQSDPMFTERLTYRNIGNQCFTMCGFSAICKTAISGGNISLTKNLGYKPKEEVQV
jgi:hypothetical protein